MRNNVKEESVKENCQITPNEDSVETALGKTCKANGNQ